MFCYAGAEAPVTNDSLYWALVSASNLDVAEVLFAHGARLEDTHDVMHQLARAVKNNYSRDIDKHLDLFKAGIRFGANLQKREGNLTVLDYHIQQPAWEGRDILIGLVETELGNNIVYKY